MGATGGFGATGGAATGGAGGSAAGAAGAAGSADAVSKVETWKSKSNWSGQSCPTPPNGVTVGPKLGNYLSKINLKTCEDEDVSLDRFCGSGGQWVFVAHGWCPHCKLTASLAEKIHADYVDKDLASVVVLVENASGGIPTAQDCKTWRQIYGLYNVAALYDPTGASKALYEQNYTALNVFIGPDRIIKSKQHTDVESTIRLQIAGILQ